MFQLPASLHESLSRCIRRFWWGECAGKRKTHWTPWQQYTRAKGDGGFGFRDLKLFNQALLARQAWRLVDRLESLCARVLKAKYFPNGNLLDTVFATNQSLTWKATGIAGKRGDMASWFREFHSHLARPMDS
jgi:hypothetical protein